MRESSQRRELLPFEQFSLVETASLDALQDAVSREIGHHDFAFLQKPRTFPSRVSCVRLSRTHLFGVKFGAALKANAPSTGHLQLVLPLAGSVVKHDGAQSFRVCNGSAFFIHPEQAVDVDFNRDSVSAIIAVDGAKLNSMFRATLGPLGSPELRFPDVINLRRGVGLSIANLARLIITELRDEKTLFSRGITSKSIEENLLLSLINVANSSQPPGLRSACTSKLLRAALDYIHAHLQNEISVTDLARFTGVSIRKLQYDFQNAFGISPNALIRHEKLKRIRTELERMEESSSSVAEVAARWSYFDRSYFTRIYKNEFGETPSETLRRTSGCGISEI